MSKEILENFPINTFKENFFSLILTTLILISFLAYIIPLIENPIILLIVIVLFLMTMSKLASQAQTKNRAKIIKRRVVEQVELSTELSVKNFERDDQINKILINDIVEAYSFYGERMLLGKNWLISNKTIIYIKNIIEIVLRKERHSTKWSDKTYLNIYFRLSNKKLYLFSGIFLYNNSDIEKERLKNISKGVEGVNKICSYISQEIPMFYISSKKEKIELKNLARFILD